MAKDPAILFYTSDFLIGTQFFTDTQCGQYIRLLCTQHQQGHIPDDHMKKICKTYDNPVFAKFIKDDEGKYFNERMENEILKRKKYSESRSDNRKKKKTDEIICLSHDEHMENENHTTTLIKDKEEITNGSLSKQHPTFEFISESLSGKIWQEQVCMKMKWDETYFAEYVIRWLAKKELSGTYDYPVNAMKDFVIKDYEKECMNKKSKSAIPHYLNGM